MPTEQMKMKDDQIELKESTSYSMADCDPPKLPPGDENPDHVVAAVDSDGNPIATGFTHQEVAIKVHELSKKKGMEECMPYSFYAISKK